MKNNNTFMAIPFSEGQSITAEEILEYYDGARLFTAHSNNGNLLLVSWFDDSETWDKYVVTYISDQTLNDLKDCKISLYDALNINSVWVIKQNLKGEILTIKGFKNLKEVDKKYPNSLPEPDAMLREYNEG